MENTCILAFLSQSEKIYWNMQSKVLGQLEANDLSILSQKYLVEQLEMQGRKKTNYQITYHTKNLNMGLDCVNFEMGLGD